MQKLLFLALLSAAAGAPRLALAQATAPLPLRPVSVQLAPADSLPRRLHEDYFSRITCFVGITTRTDDLFFPAITVQPLLSRAAGVQVTPHSGAPGDWATVRIRGSGLRGADQPLYVIDGLPALNADFAPVQAAPLPLYSWGTGPQVSAAAPNPLLFVAPQDISSVEILKGAGATTRYGSQGANGVILITTKRGGRASAAQAPQLHYEGLAGVQQVRRRVALLDARQYADLANEVWRTAGSRGSAPFDAATLAGLGTGTDWQGELFGAALLQSHALSLGGSTARTRYLASANYLGQSGVVLNSALHRYALRLALDHTFTLKLKGWLNVAGASIDRTLPPAGTVPTALLAAPTVPATTGGEPTNPTDFVPLPGYPAPFFNPLALAQQAATTDATRRLLAQAGLSWQLAPTLRLEGRLSEELATTTATNRGLASQPAPAAPVPRETLRTTQRLATTNAQASLHYQRPGGTRHAFGAEATLLAQRLGRTQEQAAFAGSGILGSGTSTGEYALTVFSALAYAQYSYDERLHLSATLRADRAGAASYALGTGGAVQVYPALAAAWNLDQESFLRGSGLVSRLKLLAAVGQCSNNAIAASSFPAGPGAGSVVSLISPNVPTPSRTTQLNVAVEAGFFNGHLEVQPTFYSHYTAHANVAQALPTPTSAGFTDLLLITRDVALRNQGLELALTYHQQSASGQVSSTLRLAAAHNQQTVLAIADETLAVPGLAVGESIHPYFGYQRAGLSATGTIQYRDVNGDGRLDYQDAGYFGNGLPSWLLDFSQELKVSRWALQTQFDALLGYQLLSPTLARLDYPSGGTNGSPRLLDRWTPAHPGTDVPATGYARPFTYDQLAAESASHLRLSQLTLSYQLRALDQPRPLQVWVGAQNLFVLTSYRGYDPNVSSGGGAGQLAGYDASQYPVARVWQAGVRASF